jgi:hypothetical protein
VDTAGWALVVAIASVSGTTGLGFWSVRTEHQRRKQEVADRQSARLLWRAAWDDEVTVYLYAKNEGHADAWDITGTLTGPERDVLRFNYDFIKPGQDAKVFEWPHHAFCGTPFDISWQWNDDRVDGDHNDAQVISHLDPPQL